MNDFLVTRASELVPGDMVRSGDHVWLVIGSWSDSCERIGAHRHGFQSTVAFVLRAFEVGTSIFVHDDNVDVFKTWDCHPDDVFYKATC